MRATIQGSTDDRSLAPEIRAEPRPRATALAPRTTFRIGGSARCYYAPATVAEFRAVLVRVARESSAPFFLGGGANVLFPDGEFDRPVISTEKLRGVEVRGRTIRAEAGVRLNTLIKTAIQAGLSGLEYFVGIPGTCGGGVAMNAGGRYGSLGERVTELGLMPLGGGPVEVVRGDDIVWNYRSSELGGRAVAWATFELAPGSSSELRREAGAFMREKAGTQPVHALSAGCVFRNPPGRSAGELLDRAGLKGRGIGGAQFSDVHANFIINVNGDATARDVRALVDAARREVDSQFGVRLETEMVLA